MVEFLFLIIFMLIKLKANNINKETTLIIENQNNNSFLENILPITNNLTIKKKNLILGVIKNYGWNIIYPFFISFKKAGFNNCECVMFIGQIEQETINKISSFGVKVIQIERHIDARINSFRYKLYEDFLRNNPDKYNLVLTIDVRDSFFQKDIFKYYENYKSYLVLVIEDGYLSEIVNKGWIIDAFDKNIYKIIKNERIICSGTILGTSDKTLEFSSMIWKYLNQNNYSRKNWHDQAVVNYLIYYKKLFHNDSIIWSENKDGPILTLATANPKNFMIDSEDNILNGKGEIAAVIHQYDRHKNITKKILKKYNTHSIEENKYENYNKSVSSNLYLNQSQLIEDYNNLSLTNISNNNKIIPKENDNFYIENKINKKVKIVSFFIFFSILIILFIILFLVFGKFKKKKALKYKYKYKKNKINIFEDKSTENSHLIYVLNDD